MTTTTQEFTTGETYGLSSEEGHGTGAGAISTGTVVTVVGVVPSGTAGVGVTDDGSDVVLVSFDENDTTRTVAIAASEFAGLFKKAA